MNIFLHRAISFLLESRKPHVFVMQVVLVTGAAQGLGKELAIKFSNAGGRLVLWDINEVRFSVVNVKLR